MLSLPLGGAARRDAGELCERERGQRELDGKAERGYMERGKKADEIGKQHEKHCVTIPLARETF